MNQLQSDYFMSVARTKSITRSAAALYVSPPAVSKQIALLEKELNLQLFTRSGRGMELTPAGDIMYNYFMNQNSALQYSVRKARNIDSLHTRTLHLGIVEDWSIYDKLFQLRQFLLKEPHFTTLAVQCCGAGSIVKRLEAGDIDAMLSISGEIVGAERLNGIDSVPITKIRKIFLFSSFIPLASKKNLQPRDFADVPLLTISNTVRFIAQNENQLICNALGFNPHIVPRDDFDNLLVSVGTGNGFVIVDEWSNKKDLPAFSYLPLEDRHPISLAWLKKNQNPALEAMVDYCANEIDWGPGKE